jgi:hypothetical protein
MEPAEIMDVVMDENDRVIEIRGSQELFDRMDAADGGNKWPGVKRVVRKPKMMTLALPELEDENGKAN